MQENFLRTSQGEAEKRRKRRASMMVKYIILWDFIQYTTFISDMPLQPQKRKVAAKERGEKKEKVALPVKKPIQKRIKNR